MSQRIELRAVIASKQGLSCLGYYTLGNRTKHLRERLYVSVRDGAIRANERGADHVVSAYLANDEQARKDWTEWADAHSEMSGSGLGETVDSGVAPVEEPDELRGFQEAAQA